MSTATTPTIVGMTLDGLLIVGSTHGYYLVNPNWLDIPASIARWKAAGAYTEPAFRPSARSDGEQAA